MELRTIVDRYAEALAHIDATTSFVGANARTGETYLPGLQPMVESRVIRELDEVWEALHPGERHSHRVEVPYPSAAVSARTRLDHVFSTDGELDAEEWGVELKRLQFVGDNGGPGGNEVAKVLSPYLKDRGMLHDALRLREYGFTRRIAVIAYGFDYDLDTLSHALTLHTEHRAVQTIRKISGLVKRDGPLHNRPLIEFADAILGLRGYIKGVRAQAQFDAWRHPAGGRGIVFGWEIRRPALEPDYDPRHPW